MSVDCDRRSVFEVDVPTHVQQVEVAADRDVGVGPGVQGDALENVERVQGAADGDRCARLNGVEGDPVDSRRAVDDKRSDQVRGMEALDCRDRAAVDRDLADVEDMGHSGLTVGVAMGVTLANWRRQGVDRELGIGGRAIHDDTDLAIRHGIDPEGADRLRELCGLIRRAESARFAECSAYRFPRLHPPWTSRRYWRCTLTGSGSASHPRKPHWRPGRPGSSGPRRHESSGSGDSTAGRSARTAARSRERQRLPGGA